MHGSCNLKTAVQGSSYIWDIDFILNNLINFILIPYACHAYSNLKIGKMCFILDDFKAPSH